MNNLKQSFGKSGFLIIIPNSDDRKSNIVLHSSGALKCKHSFQYLGVCISDSGVIRNYEVFRRPKALKPVYKILEPFLVNRNAPRSVKLKTLYLCVSSAITHAGETWGNNIIDPDLCYRAGLQAAMNTSENSNHEIV